MNEYKKIYNFSPRIDILNNTHKQYLKNFKTGSKYPEKGIGTYLINDAFEDIDNGNGVTYVIINEVNGEKEIVSFFSLLSSSILCKYKDNDYETNFYIPAIKISMFAVNEKYQDTFINDFSMPVSAMIFKLIVGIVDTYSKKVLGVKAIYLHPLDSAIDFYKKNGMKLAENYMVNVDDNDSIEKMMYMFIREVKGIVYN